MANNSYLGSSGIWSTGDDSADQSQVEAEQHSSEEETEEEENQPEIIRGFVGGIDCLTQWWLTDLIEKAGKQTWEFEMKARHKKECGCDAMLSFSYNE